MKRTVQILVVLAFILLLILAPANAAIKIADDLYLAEGVAGGNTAFLVTGEGVVVVDSGTSQSDAAALLADIRLVTSQPVRFLILTHHHLDHTFGAAYFPADTVIIGHENLEPNLKQFMNTGYQQYLHKLVPEQIATLKAQIARLENEAGAAPENVRQALKRAEARYDALKNARVVFPNVVMSDKLTLSVGGQRIVLSFLGAGHTTDNIVVYFPQQRVLHAGDLVFNGSFPYIFAGPGGANTAQWLGALDELAKWDVDKVIPGHGAIGSKDILKKQAELLTDLRSAVSEAIGNGQEVADAQKMITLPKYGDYKNKEILAMDIESVYIEIKAANSATTAQVRNNGN